MIPVVYLDHHATTPLDPRVLAAMMPYLTEEYGNPSSSTHDLGRRARRATEEARAHVATLLGAQPGEIIFTAGATEANNLALKGAARAIRRAGGGHHLLTTATEHKSVSVTMADLQAEGFELTVLRPDPEGTVRAEDVAAALRDDTILVSVLAVDGEIGTVQPLAAIAGVCSERGVRFHTDATQMVGKLAVDVRRWGVDLLSLSAHKFYGPKGVGALFRREGVELEPLLSGGGQEGGLRSGTLNVPGIVGLGETCRLRAREMEAEAPVLAALRDRLWAGIRERVPDARLNGHPGRRLPGNLNVAFPGAPAAELMAALEGFALSAGSACLSEGGQASEVLLAIGLDPALAGCALRFGLGRGTTGADVERAVESVAAAVARARGGPADPGAL